MKKPYDKDNSFRNVFSQKVNLLLFSVFFLTLMFIFLAPISNIFAEEKIEKQQGLPIIDIGTTEKLHIANLISAQSLPKDNPGLEITIKKGKLKSDRGKTFVSHHA